MHQLTAGRTQVRGGRPQQPEPLNETQKRDLSVDSAGQVVPEGPEPDLFHKIKDEKSILSLAVANGRIYAGTQGGTIVVWSLDDYEQLYKTRAHIGAVLGLHLFEKQTMLCSCAADAIVNVWDAEGMTRLYSIYSTHDVGDVFCAVYSSGLKSVYLGAQNTSIQWCSLDDEGNSAPDLMRHPSQRMHRFFDSKGPGGVSTPRSVDITEEVQQGGQILEMDKAHYVEYAHNGYVNCMLVTRHLAGSSSRESDMLVSGGADATIKIWRPSKNSLDLEAVLSTSENSDGQILCMAASQNLLYVGRSEGEVNVWDLQTLQCVRTFSVQKGDIMTICVGQGVLYTGGEGGLAQIHERYKCKSAWKAHSELILASTVVEHNKHLYHITGGNDASIAVWDLTKFFEAKIDLAKTSHEEMVQHLSRFIYYKTVSSDPDCSEDCRQAASWLSRLFHGFGASSRLLKTEGDCNPVVFAEFKANRKSATRILFYGHYDIVPADESSSRWNSDPFLLEGRNGFLYGRGVSDNKGPILAAIFAVADLAAEKKLDCDVVFILEGEEESGSKGFEAVIKANKNLIGTIDWILLSNSYWLNDYYPCLTYGLRGVVRASIIVEGGTRDLHSGVDGSHLIHEPLKDVLALVSAVAKANGDIPLPGFYDHVLEPTAAENKRYEQLSEFLSEQQSEQDVESMRAKWCEPSLTVHGFDSSSSGNPTVIPHRASASISLRLVPDQSAETIQDTLVSFLEQQWDELGSQNKLSIVTGHAVDPWLGDPSNELYRALEKAVIDVWELDTANEDDSAQPEDEELQKSKPGITRVTTKGVKSDSQRSASHSKKANIPLRSKEVKAEKLDVDEPAVSPRSALRRPLYIREGGSIPVIRFLEKEFDAPAAQLPCGQSSDNAHLDNERLRLLNLYNSRKIFRKVFEQMAEP